MKGLTLTLQIDEAMAQALPALRPWLGRRVELSLRELEPAPPVALDSDPSKAKAVLDGKLGEDA